MEFTKRVNGKSETLDKLRRNKKFVTYTKKRRPIQMANTKVERKKPIQPVM